MAPKNMRRRVIFGCTGTAIVLTRPLMLQCQLYNSQSPYLHIFAVLVAVALVANATEPSGQNTFHTGANVEVEKFQDSAADQGQDKQTQGKRPCFPVYGKSCARCYCPRGST